MVVKDGYVFCEKCNGKEFVVDIVKTYLPPKQPIYFKVGGSTPFEMRDGKIYLQCKACGHALSQGMQKENMPETVTVTFTLKPKNEA